MGLSNARVIREGVKNTWSDKLGDRFLKDAKLKILFSELSRVQNIYQTERGTMGNFLSETFSMFQASQKYSIHN